MALEQCENCKYNHIEESGLLRGFHICTMGFNQHREKCLRFKPKKE